jgi:hypothetical protein
MASFSEVKYVLGQFSVIYGRPVTPEQVEAWSPILEDLPADLLARAADKHVRESRFYPTPADLLARAVRRDDIPTPEEAWRQVKCQISAVGSYGTPTWSHSAVSQAVEAMGWETLCSMDVASQSAERAHFMRIYGSYREERVTASRIGASPSTLAGLIEGMGA